MICKSCGSPIPSALLRRDSFSCPNCGRTYRRSSGRAQSAPVSRTSPSPRAGNTAPSKARTASAPPKWLLYAVAGLLALALLVCCVVLLSGRGSGNVSPACGVLMPGAIAKNKTVTTTVNIPQKYGIDYIVAVESDTIGIVFSVKNKTASSFDLVTKNTTGKERSPKVSWVLVPHAPIDEG